MRLDANGTQSWEDINLVLTNTQSTTDNPVFWLLNGNTISGSEFIGTKTNYPLIFRTNDIEHMRITTKGQIEFLNTAGSVLIGEGAGNSQDMTSIRYNVFVGYQAGYCNTTGYYNTANGSQALYSNTTGNSNIANGYAALYSNTTGNNNIANGYAALYSNTTGNNNTANGAFALYSNTTGSDNTANGAFALLGNTTGYENTANGAFALLGNTTGSYNTANGNEALYNNTTGSYNTANGYLALRVNTTGNNNTANGYFALRNNTTGINNAALGYNAGAGDWGVNFNQCTFVGAHSYPTTNRTNVTMLGYGITNAQCTGDNQVLLGNTSVTQISAAVNSITSYSDGRYKTNIENNVHGLDFVMKLKPITYSTDPRKLHKIWGTSDSVIDNMDVSDAMSKRYIGFIAQDVEQAAKECGFAFPGIDVPKNDKEVYTLRYVDFIMPMVKSIQEQQTTIEQLQSENQALKEQMAILIKEIENIKQEIANGNLEQNNEELFGEKK